jgi:hypothetical protein
VNVTDVNSVTNSELVFKLAIVSFFIVVILNFIV